MVKSFATRSDDKRLLYKRTRRGIGNPHWKGGRVLTRNGYVAILCTWYPGGKYAGKYVLEHRLVMSFHLNRPLEPHEAVHHINGDKTDNLLENLHLTTNRAHRKEFHRSEIT